MEYSDRELAYFQQIRLAVLVPASRGYWQFWRSLANAIAFSWAHGVKVYECGVVAGQVVHWARDDLANQALEATSPEGAYTHFLWLDDDHIFKPHMICQLARHMAGHSEIDAISALYYARTGKPLPVVYVKDRSSDSKYQHFPLLGVPETLCEVDAVGFGAMLMKRELLVGMPRPMFRFVGCGEDIYFCTNAKEAGFRIFLDGSLKIGHIGEPTIIDDATFSRYETEHKEELGERIKISLGGHYV